LSLSSSAALHVFFSSPTHVPLAHSPPETVPTDLVFLRSVGIISLKKRHAFSHFFARREGSEDPARRVAIAAQEAARLASLQNAQLERQLAFARAKADAESGLTEEELRAERREEEGDESVTIEELMAEKRQEERLEGLDAELAERRKKLEERKVRQSLWVLPLNVAEEIRSLPLFGRTHRTTSRGDGGCSPSSSSSLQRSRC
jgi:hypothetical protein